MVKKPKPKIMMTPEGFNELFDYHLLNSHSHYFAYLECEKDHVELCGYNRYASYNSFQVLRGRYLK